MSRRIVLMLLTLVAAANVFAATTNRYLVSTRGPLGVAKVPFLRDGGEIANDRSVRAFTNLDTFALDLTDDEVRALRLSSDVRYVEPVEERHLLDAGGQAILPVSVNGQAGFPVLQANASKYSTQQTVPWGIAAIHAPDVWSVGKGSGTVNLVMLDTGIDVQHPDLADNYAGGYNAFSPADAPLDDNGHGTHVAGTVAGEDNAFGIVGVAPKTRVWSVKVLDANGRGDTEQVSAGVDWVLGQKKALGGNWIISLSLGSDLAAPSEREAFQRAYDAGILTVAAAGNKGLGALSYPAGYPTVLSAGAVDENLDRAGFSSWGANLGVMAPGVNVLSTARVGSIPASDIQTDNNLTFNAHPFKGSPKGEVWTSYVFCKLGYPEDFPLEVRGRIAVIQRGCGSGTAQFDCTFSFNEKVKNAIAAGAKAAVIYNSPTGIEDLERWSLIRFECENGDCHDFKDDVDFPWIVTLGVTYDDGIKLLNSKAKTFVASYRAEDYQTLNGTSMAAPHVSGAAALIWSLAPSATSRDVRNALAGSAKDLGPAGYDDHYGYGLVDALGAARLLAPQLFGLPPTPSAPKRHPNS
jgi:serine protease